MAPKFGTSGLRGLVVDLTSELVADYVRAFVTACDIGKAIYVGHDLRPSSPRIAEATIEAVRDMGFDVVSCGAVPTPALALAAMQANAGAVMITGSHIPSDRNGLKFYTQTGEITKTDEAAILAALGHAPAGLNGGLKERTDVSDGFVMRYVNACGRDALAGRRIGVYAHSAVGRDDLGAILRGLGAEVLELGRSDQFIPVDTEAVDPTVRSQIADWMQSNALDALVSTDGDSDRPLLADETGQIVPGDVLGQITAQALGADHVVTPISSNSGVLQKGFAKVITTRIGSPYVISGMQDVGGHVVGYEANGGFLLGFEAKARAGPLTPLMTRDCMAPLVMTLIASGSSSVSARVAQEPAVVTLSNRLQEVAQDVSGPFVARLRDDGGARAAFLASFGQEETSLDLTDGVRMRLVSGATVHVRPSGNAPELRLYVEAKDPSAAHDLMAAGLQRLRAVLQR